MTEAKFKTFIETLGGRESLIIEVSNTKEDLFGMIDGLKTHLRVKHNGKWPASVCHDCLSLSQGIRSARRMISQAEHELGKIED